MSLVGYDRPPLQAPGIYIPFKDAVTCRIVPELGGCLSQRASSGTIPTRYGTFIPAVEAAGPRNVTFDGGLLKVGVYLSLVAESRHIYIYIYMNKMHNIRGLFGQERIC